MGAAVAILGVGVLAMVALIIWFVLRSPPRSEIEVLSEEIARHLLLAARASEDGKPGLYEEHMAMVELLKQHLQT